MQISVSGATDLVRRAEAGDDVVLTRHGQPAVRLVAIKMVGDRASHRENLESFGGERLRRRFRAWRLRASFPLAKKAQPRGPSDKLQCPARR